MLILLHMLAYLTGQRMRTLRIPLVLEALEAPVEAVGSMGNPSEGHDPIELLEIRRSKTTSSIRNYTYDI